jgi:hypothetical protein
MKPNIEWGKLRVQEARQMLIGYAAAAFVNVEDIFKSKFLFLTIYIYIYRERERESRQKRFLTLEK